MQLLPTINGLRLIIILALYLHWMLNNTENESVVSVSKITDKL